MSLAMLAYVFHWPPAELLALTRDDLDFWGGRLRDVQRALEQARKG